MTQINRRHLSERARLASELHDGIAQDLVGVGYSLDLLLATPNTSVEARAQLRTLRFTITDLIDKVRKEIFDLRQLPATGLKRELLNAASQYCKDLELHIALDEIPQSLESELCYEISRIAQEVLRNIGQHARAHTLFISLRSKNEILELLIVDDGIGGVANTKGHFGIQSMLDRATGIGGVLSIQSDVQGTRVSLRIPMTIYATE